MTSQEYQQISHTIHNLPGIYKYYDNKHDLLYVGKAKNLRKRTGSYFSKTFTNYKTHELVQRIHIIEFTITDTEADAFLLENSLIKQYKTIRLIIIMPMSKTVLKKPVNFGNRRRHPTANIGIK